MNIKGQIELGDGNSDVKFSDIEKGGARLIWIDITEQAEPGLFESAEISLTLEQARELHAWLGSIVQE